ncbi:MAG: hypothetical protein LQ348_005653 [Seirophora lacunosa]|nr:MAG: hypothetical protein LQ348_005653 [Seirophora lacunosa]
MSHLSIRGKLAPLAVVANQFTDFQEGRRPGHPPIFQRLPGPKLDRNGDIIYEKWPKNPEEPEPLLDFPHLPDQIGSQEWWFIFEAWRRFEPRARWKDFTMRIHGPSRPSSHNIIQMHISRNRPKWGLLCWFTIVLHDEKNGARDEALRRLSDKQIKNNTTRGTTPGFIDPVLGEAGGRVPLPKMGVGAGGRRSYKAPQKGSRKSVRNKNKAGASMNITRQALDDPDLPTSVHEIGNGDSEEEQLSTGHGVFIDYRFTREYFIKKGTNSSTHTNFPTTAADLPQHPTCAAPSSSLLSNGRVPPKGKKRKVREAFGTAEDVEAWRAQQIPRLENPSHPTGVGHSYSREADSQVSAAPAWPPFLDESSMRPNCDPYATKMWITPDGSLRQLSDFAEPGPQSFHYDIADSLDLLQDQGRAAAEAYYSKDSTTTDTMSSSAKLTLQSTIPILNSPHTMPRLGFGIYRSPPDVCVASCLTALRAGYRHIDSAQFYQNEREMGEAVRQAGIPRGEVFLTTKVLSAAGSVDKTYAKCLDSVATIDPGHNGYVDLFLIHSPNSGAKNRKEMWQALERLHADGKARAIGVSNFGKGHVEEMKAWAKVWPPAVNQIELHPWNQQREIVDYCNAHGIVVQAYCPLVRNLKAHDETLVAVAEKHAKPTGQVLIRYCLQKGWVPLPKSDTPKRIEANADVYGFELDGEDMATLDGLDQGERGAIVQAVSNA